MEAINLLPTIISGLIGGVVTGIASYTAISVHIEYMQRDIKRTEDRQDIHATVMSSIETRITRLESVSHAPFKKAATISNTTT